MDEITLERDMVRITLDGKYWVKKYVEYQNMFYIKFKTQYYI